MAQKPALEIRNLRTAFPGENGPIHLVNDVSLSVKAGETLAIVGESGSGKTMTFLSAVGLVPPPGRVIGGEVLLDGTDLLKLDPAALRRFRGPRIAMVFQDPLTGLNPVFPIGEQLVEVLRAHMPTDRQTARRRAIQLLDRVQIPSARQRFGEYPHQFSGGMRQRVLIAMAIALNPSVLIADEPTTALDVSVQAQVLELLADLQREFSMALVLITHDLGVVARHATRMAVMYGGRIVESGAIDKVYARSAHPYTEALFRSLPRLDTLAGSDLSPIEGQPPDPAAMPAGCAFEPRCFLGHGRPICGSERPPLQPLDPDGLHLSACHFRDELERVA
ncbi:ABC transporter ATP-binding protein [Roseomonas marmotae]|uniref:ABC transporter ATP-binding protein n=1 Tax=Roseomonas marmotae TaxID=2768161 RepID=A0ABS3KCB9_9PROT|nr:ABC transporter ATP-binding protein [Roseomonas marmotae]MBO1074627.1 ABC transporter ATP-binding protein [Roseomonas marmotae]QTI81648.1 ABC transporter ATP-binding protein [Roseomonas marmotae]